MNDESNSEKTNRKLSRNVAGDSPYVTKYGSNPATLRGIFPEWNDELLTEFVRNDGLLRVSYSYENCGENPEQECIQIDSNLKKPETRFSPNATEEEKTQFERELREISTKIGRAEEIGHAEEIGRTEKTPSRTLRRTQSSGVGQSLVIPHDGDFERELLKLEVPPDFGDDDPSFKESDLLIEIGRDPNPVVRKAVASNHKTPDKELARLFQDDDGEVRKAAYANLTLRTSAVWQDVVHERIRQDTKFPGQEVPVALGTEKSIRMSEQDEKIKREFCELVTSTGSLSHRTILEEEEAELYTKMEKYAAEMRAGNPTEDTYLAMRDEAIQVIALLVRLLTAPYLKPLPNDLKNLY